MSVVRPVKREIGARAGEKRELPSRALQELWFATRRREWKSLVVVPASPGSSALHIAQALGEVGGAIRMSPVQVVNAEGMDLDGIATMVLDISVLDEPELKKPEPKGSVWTSGSGGWDSPANVARGAPAPRAIIIAIEAVAENPLILPLALAADAVLLCVEMGRTRLEDARHTVELIGRDRIIGTVLLQAG
jgi:hypothetical protein